MIIKISKNLYPKTVLLKAAYSFTDKAYIYISQDTDNYSIHIESKNKDNLITEKEFQNELLSQALRYDVFEKTKNIRELIVSRSLASTIIDESNNEFEYEDNQIEEDILKDWFENND